MRNDFQIAKKFDLNEPIEYNKVWLAKRVLAVLTSKVCMFRCIFFALVFSFSCFADSPEANESCPDGKQHYRATIRHIESGGIGYEDGYTTLEAFFASDPSQWIVTPLSRCQGAIFLITENGQLTQALASELYGEAELMA